MPMYFRCDGCELAFETGWFHYHGHYEYGSETRLVCSSCGTLHRLQHAVGDDLPDMFSAQPRPLNVSTDAPRLANLSAQDAEFLERSRLPPVVALIGELMRDAMTQWGDDVTAYNVRVDRAEWPVHSLNVESLRCAYCEATGCMTEWQEDNDHCPRCKQNKLSYLGEYMT
jgi:hypothetical protein